MTIEKLPSGNYRITKMVRGNDIEPPSIIGPRSWKPKRSFRK